MLVVSAYFPEICKILILTFATKLYYNCTIFYFLPCSHATIVDLYQWWFDSKVKSNELKPFIVDIQNVPIIDNLSHYAMQE